MNHPSPVFLRPKRGQGLLEYIALTALVAIVSLSAVKLLGSKVKTHVSRATSSFDRTMRAGFNAARSSTSSDAMEDSGDSTPPVSNNPGLPQPTGRPPSRFPWPF